MPFSGQKYTKCLVCLFFVASGLWIERDSVTIMIIGSPGHGKSTFLNLMAGDKKAFKVAASADSCTKEVSNKTFDVAIGEAQKMKKFKLISIDSPGFPDPNASKAIELYDQVISAARQPLNAIIWLVKQERTVHPLMNQYKLLLREFNKAQPPIFLVVNGQENYDDDEERQERIVNDRHDATIFGQACAKAAGLSIAQMIVSTTKPDLKKVAQDVFLAALSFDPKNSTLKTFAELEAEVLACKDDAAKVKLELNKIDEAIQKAHASISWIQHVKGLVSTAGVTLKATGWPITDGVLASIPTFLRMTFDERVNELQEVIREKKQEQADLQAHDPSEVVSKLESKLLDLKNALKGP